MTHTHVKVSVHLVCLQIGCHEYCWVEAAALGVGPVGGVDVPHWSCLCGQWVVQGSDQPGSRGTG